MVLGGVSAGSVGHAEPADDPVSARDRQTSSLVRNTVAQSGGRLAAYVLSFVSAPIVLHGLGLRNFGIWAVSGALAQYAGLLDLGVGFSVARYIARDPDDLVAFAIAGIAEPEALADGATARGGLFGRPAWVVSQPRRLVPEPRTACGNR